MAVKLGESLDKRFGGDEHEEGKKGENESGLRENIESLVVSHVRAINFRYKARAIRFYVRLILTQAFESETRLISIYSTQRALYISIRNEFFKYNTRWIFSGHGTSSWSLITR